MKHLQNQTMNSIHDLFQQYLPRENFWDEMCSASGIREPYEVMYEFFKNTPVDAFHEREQLSKKLFMRQGITFTVYADNEGIERIFPFDIIPRIITASDWAFIDKGIKQRLRALNLFLKDIYSDQQIIKDGIIPGELIYSCPHFLRQVVGLKVPFDIYIHIAGIDLVRDSDGSYVVLEDNLRTPSGVSYMIENREVTKRIFPNLFPRNRIRSVTDYPLILHDNLVSLSPRQVKNPGIVLLTPGIYNSAYFEHTFLARFMGIELVEGRDLVVENHHVYMKTTRGLQEVDVIYRRVDDDFIDPLEFNPGSILGVPGLMSAYRKGNVSIVNAVGNGVADDKAVYVYVPEMIKYYLNETPILNNVKTYQMSNRDEREFALENLDRMVVKMTNEAGGNGMVMGDKASDEELEKARQDILKNPRDFIAQPIVNISTSPCFIDGKLQPRHIDLRPYALCGPDGIEIIPGGLTRTALREGSLVVNSSQGGGSKDTWVLLGK